MVTRAQIVAEAESWKGTPHVWQASRKGRGCDCKGLIAGVARELDLPESRSVYALMHSYGKVDVRLLRRGMAVVFDQTDQMEPGNVLLLKMLGHPQHLAILGHGEIIHTYAKGPECVVGAHLEPALRLWPLDSIWAWRGVG